MGKISSIGIYNGLVTEFQVTKPNNKLLIYVNNVENELIQELFDSLLDEEFTVAGTYVPPRNSLLNGLAILEQGIYDDGERVTITTEGDIGKVPSVDGRTY